MGGRCAIHIRMPYLFERHSIGWATKIDNRNLRTRRGNLSDWVLRNFLIEKTPRNYGFRLRDVLMITLPSIPGVAATPWRNIFNLTEAQPHSLRPECESAWIYDQRPWKITQHPWNFSPRWPDW